MSDSIENTNELDSYGVWVKRPPQDAVPEESSISSDLPDFAPIDDFSATENNLSDDVVSDDFNFDSLDDEDTSLSAQELSDITSEFSMEEVSTEPAAEEPVIDQPAEPQAEASDSIMETSFDDMFADIPEPEAPAEDFNMPEDNTSSVNEESPSIMEETSPVIEESAPVFEETSPVIEESAPVMDETSSVTDDISFSDSDIPSFDNGFEATDMTGFTADAPVQETPVTEFETPVQEEAAPSPSIEETVIPDEAFDVSAFEDGDINLDDFMDSGFNDPNPGATTDISLDAFGADGEISLDDFLDDGGSSINKEDDIANDDPLDIDVSFNESEENAVPVEEVKNFDNSEEYDDMYDKIDEEAVKESETVSAAPSFETEEISLDDFGLDENSDDATAVAAGAQVNSSIEGNGGTEEIDLSDFGIDSSAGETPVEQDVQGAKKGHKVDYDLAINEDDDGGSSSSSSSAALSDSPSVEDFIEDDSSKVSNKLLEQIIADLSGLKNEINSLKDDLEVLKTKETIPVPQENAFVAATEPVQETIEQAAADETPFPVEDEINTEVSIPESEETFESTEVPQEENTVIEPAADSNCGFFSNVDEDDTIALSGDELENIMNTVDISEETSEVTSDSEEEQPVIEEPVIEENTAETEITTEPVFDDQPATENEVFETEETVTEEPSITETCTEETACEPVLDDIQEETVTTVEEPTEENNMETASEETFGDENENNDNLGLVMNSENDSLIEPDLNAIDNALQEEEVSIPSIDDFATEDEIASSILVESSKDDFIDSVKDSNEDVSIPTADDMLEEPETEQTTEDNLMDDILKEDPTVEEQISDENMNYLNEEPVIDDTENEPIFDDDEVPTVEGIIAASKANADAMASEPAAEQTEQENTVIEQKPATELVEETVEPERQDNSFPEDLKSDVKSVLLYMDQLLENLPEDKIVEFAKSEQFATYKKLFNELGLK